MSVKVENRCDIGMVKFGQCQCFLPEALAGVFILEGSSRQDFESNLTVKTLILSEVDNTHPTCTKLLQDEVVAQLVSDQMWRRRHFGGMLGPSHPGVNRWRRS